MHPGRQEVRVLRFLIIEDDPKISKDVSFYLQVRYPNAAIMTSCEGQKGIQILETDSPDMVIADSTLSDMSHREFVIRIRQFSEVPLLILSEIETDVDRAEILELGADDFVLKPFSPIELLARIGALMRRISGFGFNSKRLVFISDEVSIDFNTREVFLSGKRVKLTPIEYELFSELARNAGRVLTHRVLLQKIWGADSSGDHNFIKKYIYRLRSKLEPDGERRLLVSERGIGYKLIKFSERKDGAEIGKLPKGV